MRRLPAWWVGIGVVVGWALSPASAQAVDGFWVTLAAGLAGSSSPSSTDEFWFDTPHGPGLIGVNQLSGGTTAEAGTGGGTVFFGGAGTPVLLNLSNGSAYVSGGAAPDAAKAASAKSGSPASAAPTAGGTLPSNAALLGLKLADPDAAGARALTAAITDPNGNPLGTGTVAVPGDGWWVVGLTPGATTDPPPPPPVDPPPSHGGGGPVATPEPSALLIVALGGLTTGAWRRVARRKTV